MRAMPLLGCMPYSFLAWAKRGCGDCPAGLHVDFHDRTHLHRSADLEDRAAQRQLGRLGQVARLDERVAADEVLRLGERAVRDAPLPAVDHLAGPLQGMAGILEVALL